mgnify:CR=1 FL=1
MPETIRIGIIGAGAWGTSLGMVARRAGCDVTIWAHESETVSERLDQITYDLRYADPLRAYSVAVDIEALRAEAERFPLREPGVARRAQIRDIFGDGPGEPRPSAHALVQVRRRRGDGAQLTSAFTQCRTQQAIPFGLLGRLVVRLVRGGHRRGCDIMRSGRLASDD